MSLTTTSGPNPSSSGTIARAASPAPGDSPGGGGGKTTYSSAASKRTPSASTGSRHRSHDSIITSWPRPAISRPSAIAGNA